MDGGSKECFESKQNMKDATWQLNGFEFLSLELD